MAAIVRVKRRRNEDPADSIIFSCKRTKLVEADSTASGDNYECFKSQFKFAGTVTKKVLYNVITVYRSRNGHHQGTMSRVTKRGRETHRIRDRKNEHIALYLTGLPLVREKSGKFKVREKSGNFVLGQGNLRF